MNYGDGSVMNLQFTGQGTKFLVMLRCPQDTVTFPSNSAENFKFHTLI